MQQANNLIRNGKACEALWEKINLNFTVNLQSRTVNFVDCVNANDMGQE